MKIFVPSIVLALTTYFFYSPKASAITWDQFAQLIGLPGSQPPSNDNSSDNQPPSYIPPQPPYYNPYPHRPYNPYPCHHGNCYYPRHHGERHSRNYSHR